MLYKKWLEYTRSKGATALVLYEEERRLFIEVFRDDDGQFVGKIVHWGNVCVCHLEICRRETWAEAWSVAQAVARGVRFALHESKEVA